MTYLLWAMAALVVADALWMVSRVGQPRKPIDGVVAAAGVVQYGTVAGLLVWAAVTR